MSGGQKEILESIRLWRKEGQLLDFGAVNNYVLEYEGGLSEEFKGEVVSVVLEGYRGNGYAIAAVANMLLKC